MWTTVRKSQLSKRRNAVEDALLLRLRLVIPESVPVTILCDCGFADRKLCDYLKTEPGFDYIVLFRSGMIVADVSGQSRPSKQWIPRTPRALMLRGARVTKEAYPVGAVVLLLDRDMQDAWCLATNRTDLSARQTAKLYGKRFTAEETFRDQTDIYFGMGLKQTHISEPKRRDRVQLICAMATAPLTLLGEDRMLRANTQKTRTHSLLRQGLYYFAALATWPEERSACLLTRFALHLSLQPFCSQISAIV